MIADARGEIKRSMASNSVATIHANGNGKHGAIRTLDSGVIKNEIKNPALKEITLNIVEIINKANNFEIDKEQAAIQIAAYKQLISVIVLDWNRKA